MSDNLEFTGERFTPECEREIWYEHMHRYAFATQWCDGASVLDAACGEGYGSAMLARAGGTVTGVDISEQAVEHARNRYANVTGLSFQVADCTHLPFDDDSFDIVVSFETLEHLSAQSELLAEFRRVLRPSGFVVLSSPDKAEYSDRMGFSNEFHTRELYRAELEELIGRSFPAFKLLGQKLMFHSAIWELEEISTARLQTVRPQGEISSGKIPHAPMYFLAVCSESLEHLPEIRESLNLFDDSDESVYGHYHHEIRKNMSAGGIIAARDAEILALKDQLTKPRKSWWRRLVGSR